MITRIEPSGGAYRRSIQIIASEDQVTADLEDDFHRFGVTLQHDGARITHIEGRALRFPWTTCKEATVPLRRLVGMEIDTSCRAVDLHTDSRFQCTHLFDIAGLAVAQAARGVGQRRYDATVADPECGERQAELRRDNAPLLVWQIVDDVIKGPAPYDGRSLLRLGKWAREHLDTDEAEAALVLRRAVHISGGRWIDLDSVSNAAALRSQATCHSFQPSVALRGQRMLGASRDFSARPEDLLRDIRTVEKGNS